jgi:putative two-component system response regulator
VNGRLLDLMLPYIDGWKVCRRLKTDDRTRTVPLVILTARDEPHGAQRAEKAGCAAYRKSPVLPLNSLR